MLEAMTATIALITGANKGIGYEVARLLGEQGSTVLVGARDPERGADAEKRLRDAGLDAHHVALDVSDEASVARAAESIDGTYGCLDILVNNAAIGGFAGGPSQTPLGVLREVFETNVFGVVAVTNAMLPLLRKAPAARIVNVSSEVGSLTSTLDVDGPLWGLNGIPYPTSKTALNMITAQYAKELWDTPIKVNAANPGYCATDLNHQSGFLSPAQGAEPIVHLATLDADGPTGTFYGNLWVSQTPDGDPEYGPLPW